MPTTCEGNDEHRFESQSKSFPAWWSKSDLHNVSDCDNELLNSGHADTNTYGAAKGEKCLSVAEATFIEY